MSNNDNVVSTTDVAPKKEPQSFNDLNKEQLVAAAEYFGSDTEGGKQAIKASLLEDGVTWDDYVKAFLAPEEEAPKEVDDVEEVVAGPAPAVATAPAQATLSETQKYLIKMTRQNLYFEFEDKKFTQEKPFAIMDAAQAQRILTQEEGFRQAYPEELQEFYS